MIASLYHLFVMKNSVHLGSTMEIMVDIISTHFIQHKLSLPNYEHFTMRPNFMQMSDVFLSEEDSGR
uniref:Ovule protein n=1 Tax=Schistosoma mansoni TaxID=6183 RepID=A0A5K4F775_SCHMA